LIYFLSPAETKIQLTNTLLKIFDYSSPFKENFNPFFNRLSIKCYQTEKIGLFDRASMAKKMQE